jgi:hypothetical protein
MITRKFLLIGLLAIGLGACSNLQTAWSIITSASVSPTQIIVAGNAFDAAEASATQYLTACKAVALPAAACTLTIRQKVVAAVRAGRSARNQLEPYVTSGTAGPSAIYNTMISSINTLQQNLPATVPGAAK